MNINLGTWVKKPSEKGINQPHVLWREHEQVNGHIIITGGSGVGKTHCIRYLLQQFNNTNKDDLRIHILDVHDDIVIPNESAISFNETSEYGLNPLTIDPSPETGGVRKTIQNLITTINKTSRKLGDRQEAVLFALMEDLYAANHYYADQPNSWVNNPKKPNIDDLQRWANYKYKQMFIGGDSRSTALLNNVSKEANNISKQLHIPFKSRSKIALDEAKEKAITAYREYVNSIGVDEQSNNKALDELLRFDSKTTLKSVVDRINNLKNSGIFKKQSPLFDPNKTVWRYRLKSLSSDEKKMFVFFKLKEIYNNALKRGLTDHIVEVVVLDEANVFMDNNDDNIINIMINEIRKFGVAIILASQSFDHFSDDILGTIGCKIILGIDEMYWDKTARKLQINKQWLNWITPRYSALVHLKRNPSPKDPSAKVKWFHTILYQ